MSIILPFSFNMEKNSSNMKEKMFIISEKTSIIARKMSIIAPSVRHPRRSVQNRGKFSSLRGRNGTVPAAFPMAGFQDVSIAAARNWVPLSHRSPAPNDFSEFGNGNCNNFPPGPVHDFFKGGQDKT